MKHRWIVAGALVALLLLLLAFSYGDDEAAPVIARSDAVHPDAPRLRGSGREPVAEPAPVFVAGTGAADVEPWALRGRVVDLRHQPVKGVEIRIDGTDVEGVWSDEDGRFALRTSRASLRVRPGPDWATDCYEVSTPNEPEVLLQVVRRLSLEIRVLDRAGRPVAGVTGMGMHGYVSSTHGQRTHTLTDDEITFGPTDASGGCTLALVASTERLTLEVVKDDYSAKEEVDFPFQSEVVLRLRPRFVITALAIDAEGEPIPIEGTLVARPADSARTIVRSDDDLLFEEIGYVHEEDEVAPSGPGEATLPRPRSLTVSGSGPWWVHVEPAGGTFASSTPVLVHSPASDLRLVCPRAVSITGRVFDKPRAHYNVYWLPAPDAEGRNRPRASGLVEGGGTLWVQGIAPGPGRLYMRSQHDDRYALIEGVEAPLKGVQVRLVEGTPLVGRVLEHESPDVVPGLTLVVRATDGDLGAWAGVEEDGTFAIRGLPPGRYDLSWRWLGWWGVVSRWTQFEGAEGVSPNEAPVELRIPR